MSDFAEFQPLLDLHDDFEAALTDHQALLVEGDLAGGTARLEALQSDLAAHIAFENGHVLPLLESAGGWSRIGDPRFYRQEHDRILALLDRFVGETRALSTAPGRVGAEIARLIGSEQSLRTLLEHHDDRERQALYRDLLAVTTPEQRLALVAEGLSGGQSDACS